MTWVSDDLPPKVRISPRAWPRVAWRGTALILLVFGGLALKLVLRLVERPVFGQHRPVTPFLTQAVCRAVLRVIGLRLTLHGRVMVGQGALVANHASWLDIFVLNAAARVFFVSKAEVADWPGIGWLARATGTLFVRRDRRDAARQTRLFAERLRAGHRLLFFPEGTSSDGLRVLPFKTTLFAAFLAPGLRDALHIQPVSIIFHPVKGHDPRFYGWWGDMDFARHLLQVLANPDPGRADLVFHTPLKMSEFASRKDLAQAAEAAVRAGFNTHA